VTPITRAGELVAAVVHDGALLGPDLSREIGSAAQLAVENERLHAEVLAQLEALRASRARIVATGDAERRRLERDLHDGAQQRLLALSYQLRGSRADAEAAGNGELAALLASGTEEVQSALDDLRALAQGIFPAVLVESGLAAALTTLAETAAIAVELGSVPEERCAPTVETAGYVAVVEAIEDAAARGASFVAVEARLCDDRLVVAVRDDGRQPQAPPTQVADRVGALGGSVAVSAATLRAEIPCA
jgi:signal transduction histidine kinase